MKGIKVPLLMESQAHMNWSQQGIWIQEKKVLIKELKHLYFWHLIQVTLPLHQRLLRPCSSCDIDYAWVKDGMVFPFKEYLESFWEQT